jgi:hypothetical protein
MVERHSVSMSLHLAEEVGLLFLLSIEQLSLFVFLVEH